MQHFRIKRSDGTFAGGEWAEEAHAEAWGKRQVRGDWKVVETDRFGNEVTPGAALQAGVATLKERVMRIPWHQGMFLTASEVTTLRALLGLNHET